MIVARYVSAWVAIQKDPVPMHLGLVPFCLAIPPKKGPQPFPHGAIFLMTPGTSCLATISLSLRDKSRSPLERLALS